MLLGIEFPNFKLSMLAIFKTSPYHLCLIGPGKHLYACCYDNCSIVPVITVFILYWKTMSFTVVVVVVREG